MNLICISKEQIVNKIVLIRGLKIVYIHILVFRESKEMEMGFF